MLDIPFSLLHVKRRLLEIGRSIWNPMGPSDHLPKILWQFFFLGKFSQKSNIWRYGVYKIVVIYPIMMYITPLSGEVCLRIPWFSNPTSGTGVEEEIDDQHDATPKDRRLHTGRQRDLSWGLDLRVVHTEDPAPRNQATNANGQNRQRLGRKGKHG